MFLFDFLFGHKRGEEPSAEPAAAVRPVAAPPSAHEHHSDAPGTGIHYDPHLIANLHEEHRHLLEIFRGMGAASKAGDLMEVQHQISLFRMAIMDHLLKENVRLYIYLEHMLQSDPVSHELMHEFRREMDAIGKVVVGFLGKYRDIGTKPDLAAGFAHDMAGIGEALVSRIKREEDTLYPMYESPDEG